MCIRDSEIDGALEKIPKDPEYARVAEQLRELATVSPSLICLLYTSDAADERSSVDLGGRRIIKKKKVYETHCWTC